MASATSAYLGRFSILPPFLQEPQIQKTRPLDVTHRKAIDAMIKDQPSAFMAMNSFQDNVLVNPFDVVINGENDHESDGEDEGVNAKTVISLKPEITHLISTHWMPWLREMDTQTTSYGYCPFYFKSQVYKVMVDEDDDSDEDDDYLYRGKNSDLMQKNRSPFPRYVGDPFIDSLRYEQYQQEKRYSQEPDTLDNTRVPPLNIPRIRNKQKLIKNVLLYYPVSPKPGMGTVETFLYDKEQYLIWKWSDDVMGPAKVGQQNYDTKMYFIVEHMPDLETGQCTSPLASLVSHWQNLVNLRKKDLEIVSEMARQEHVVEYNPSLNTSLSPTNRAYIEGMHPSTYFSNVMVGTPAGVVRESRSQQLISAINAVTQFQQNNLSPGGGGTGEGTNQGAINAGLDPMGQIINTTESRGVNPQVQALEAMNLFINQHPEAAQHLNFINQTIPNAHYLRPYQRYVPMAKPTTTITDKIIQLENEFNRLASSVLSSPIELSTGTGANQSKSGAGKGIDSQQNFLHKRIRWRIKFFCGAVKQVFTLAFLNMFQRARNDVQRLLYYHFHHNRPIEDILKLEKQLDFQVVFKPSASDMDTTQIIEFYRHGVIDEDDAYNIWFQKVGFTDPPVKAPAIFKKRMEELYRKSPEEEAEIAASAKSSAKDKAGGKKKKRPADGAADKNRAAKKQKTDKTD